MYLWEALIGGLAEHNGEAEDRQRRRRSMIPHLYHSSLLPPATLHQSYNLCAHFCIALSRSISRFPSLILAFPRRNATHQHAETDITPL